MEYRDKTEVGTKVIKVEINILSTNNNHMLFGDDKNGVHSTSYKVAFQNNSYLIIDDWYLSKFSRVAKGEKRESYNEYLNTPSLIVRTNDDIFANGIFAEIYTTGKKEAAINKLKKAIKEKISNDYGFMAIDVDEFVLNHTLD